MRVFKSAKISIIGIIISVLTVYFVVSQIDLNLFWTAWTTADYRFLVPCVIFLFLGLLTRAIRWWFLLGGKMSIVRTFSIMNIAYLVNGVLPLRIGEVARIYLVSQDKANIPSPTTISTILVERLLDLLAVVLMVMLSIMFATVPIELRIASGVGAVSVAVGFGVFLAMVAYRQIAIRLILWFTQPVQRWIDANQLVALVEQFLDGLQPLREIRFVAIALFWTLVSWILSICAGYVLMFAFFPQADVVATMLYIAAAGFAIAVPAVPGNIGTYEASILLALSALGYSESNTAVAFAVMVHAINVFVHASTGVLGFIQEGISLAQLSQGLQEMRQSNKVG